MYCDSHGSTRFPGNSEGAKRYGGDENPEQWYIHNEATGMEYELWESDGGLVLGASHEGVGLFTFYGIDREYWEHLEAQASGHTKLGKEIQVGDVILITQEEDDIYNEPWTAEVVTVDDEEGIVYVDFDKGQDMFATDLPITCYTIN